MRGSPWRFTVTVRLGGEVICTRYSLPLNV